MESIYDICDELASNGKFTTLTEIVERYLGCKVAKLDSIKEYGDLKKQLNRKKHNGFIEFKNGKNLKEGFKYKQGYDYFFRKEKEATILRKLEGDQKQLYLTGGLQMLFEGDSSSHHLIELECISELRNLGLVKKLMHFVGRRVISFKYQKGYKQEEEKEVTIHPHLLKEYNSRWFLFGYDNQQEKKDRVIHFAIDRIIYDDKNKIKSYADIPFINAPSDFYRNYFKDIVGVTKPDGAATEEIIIRTTDYKVHQLLRTKPIHSSQCETRPFNFENNEGEFTIRVIPNIELQTRILSYGPGLYVAGESKFHQQIRNAIVKMGALY